MQPQVICLANSYKLGGRCFAGRMFRGTSIGPWVRPIGDRDGEQVLLSEIAFANGASPSLLDVVGLPLRMGRPNLHQRENWTFYPNQQWVLGESIPATPTFLDRLLSNHDDLWKNTSSSQEGLRDRVGLADLKQMPDSLRFIRPDALELEVSTQDKWRCRAHFTYQGVEYRLSVTDPVYGKDRLGEVSRVIRLGPTYLTISLGEVFHGFAYKLVAGIVEVP